MTPGEIRSLYQDVADLYLHAHTPTGATDLLTVVDASWAHLATDEPTPESAEICRLAMLAAAQAKQHTIARLWRTRALARFAAIGWREGVAAIVMSEAFVELARENNDYANGRTLDVLRPSATALNILVEIERFTVGQATSFELGPGSPTQSQLHRMFHEKSGFLQLLAKDYVAAAASYQRAFTAAANSPRGQIKARLGSLLVEYLRPQGRTESTADETADLAERASAASSADLTQTARHNSQVMREHGRQLRPYEIL